MPPFQDLAGQKFGCSLVKEYVPHPIGGRGNQGRWLCQNDCGKTQLKSTGSVKKHTCACQKRNAISKAIKRHGMSNSPEHHSWMGMKSRCYNPKNDRWHHYGARGITVCERWLNSFENFYADMGPRPSPRHSLDRKDNNGNYEPDNCRWATPIEQIRNRSVARLYTLDGETLSAAEWGRRLGGTSMLVIHRMNRGWDLRLALTTPPKSKKK